MATEVGVAYVRLLPSMKGFSSHVNRELQTALKGPAAKAGDTAGAELGKGIGKGVDGQSGRLSSAAGKVGDLFKAGLATAGLAAGVALTAGLSSALDAEAAKDKLAAQLGGGDFAQEMGDVAGRLYTQAFGNSVGDTADAVRQVLQSGIMQGSDMSAGAIEAMTAQALTFSDVLDQDLNMSLQAVDRMLSTGLVNSAEEAFDILTEGIQLGVDASGDLTETFQEYSTMFREIGLGGSEAMGLLMQGLQGGARDADTVADALKEFAIRAQDGSTASAAGFEAIGLSAEDMTAAVAQGGPAAREALDQVLKGLQSMEDPAARNAAAVALFGTKAEDLGDALFGLDLEGAAAAMEGAEGAAGNLGSAYDNAQTKITAFKRQALERLVTFVGGSVIPGLERLADVVGPILSAAFDGFRNVVDSINFDRLTAMWDVFVSAINGDTAFDFAGQMGFVQDIGAAIGTAIEAVRPAVDWLASNRDVMVGAVTGVAVAITALLIPALIGLVAPLVVAVAPFIAAGAAIAALGGAMVWAYQNVQGFRDGVNAILPKLSTLFTTTFQLITTVIETAVSVATFLWGVFGDYIVEAATIAWDLVSGVIGGALDIVTGLMATATAILQGDWSAAWDGIKLVVSGAWDIIKSVFSTGFDAIKLATKIGWALIKATFMTAMTAVWEFVDKRLDSIVDFFKKLGGRVKSGISTLADTIKRPFTSAFNAIKRLWNSTVGGFSFSVPDWVPGIGGRGWSIPKMHTGGIVPGVGDVPIIAKGGEGVFTRDQMANLAPVSTMAPGETTATVVLAADGESRYIEWLRHSVRVISGGDVQSALGTS